MYARINHWSHFYITHWVVRITPYHIKFTYEYNNHINTTQANHPVKGTKNADIFRPVVHAVKKTRLEIEKEFWRLPSDFELLVWLCRAYAQLLGGTRDDWKRNRVVSLLYFSHGKSSAYWVSRWFLRCSQIRSETYHESSGVLIIRPRMRKPGKLITRKTKISLRIGTPI